MNVDIYDPWARKEEVKHEYGIDILDVLKEGKKYDSIIIAVSHNEFLQMDLAELKRENAVIFDTKACLDRNLVDARL